MNTLTRTGAAALAVLIAAWAGPAAALVEPDAAGTRAEPVADERDTRVRTVPYRPGQVVRIVLRQGQSTMVELLPGHQAYAVLGSDQDVMDGTVVEDEERPGGAPRGTDRGTASAAPAGSASAEKPCSVTPNLMTCIRRDRFISFKPITPLSPQPVHIIALRPRPNGEPEEFAYLLEIETLDINAATRVAGPDQPAPAPYYLVRFINPPPPPRPAAVAATPVRRPWTPPVVAPTPPPPPPINRAYEVQGDPSLVGAIGR